MRRAIVVVMLFLLSGCNPFMTRYKDMTGGIDVSTSALVVLPSGEPRLERGTDAAADDQRMVEDGYGLVGASYFRAGAVDINRALEQAKFVHAEIVLVYVSTAAPKVNSRGKVIKQRGLSDYLAHYWIKLKPQVLGVNVRDLTQDLQVMSGTKQGVYVVAVVKGSAAAKAGIEKGDVIRKIKDVELKKAKDLTDAVAGLAGQKVTLEVWHDHQILTKEAELGQKQ